MQGLLDIDFPPEDRERMNGLSAQAEAAVLPAEEQQELERLRRAERLLEWLHALARRALERANG